MNQAQQNAPVQCIEKSMVNVYALHTIDGLSMSVSDKEPNTDNPLFSRYPAMKLGCMSEVTWYGEQLARLAARQIRVWCAQHMAFHHKGVEGLTGDWVIIAPPYFQLPSAANLLAQVVAEQLQLQFPGAPGQGRHAFSITLVQPRLQAQSTRFATQAEFDLYYNYSKNNPAQRMAERQRVQQSLQTEQLSAQLSGKRLVVINDINVTGTQQHFMQQAFDAAGATTCLWLYILNLNAELAAAHPQIEYQINHCNVNTPGEFAQALQRDDIRHTVRCLSRLFNENETTFGHILQLLQPSHCQRLWQLAETEQRYSGGLFSNKLAWLKRAAQGELLTAGASATELKTTLANGFPQKESNNV